MLIKKIFSELSLVGLHSKATLHQFLYLTWLMKMQLESRLVSTTDNDIKFKNATLNLNWKHTFDTTGKEING